MTVDNATLRQRLETLVNSASAGDVEAIAKVRQVRDAAANGDERATTALAGLRHIYWSKKEDTASWDAAEAVYRQAAKNDPKAKIVVKAIIRRAKAGDPVAVATWARMKAIHGSTKPGALFPPGPGQARVGGYGMPSMHIPGFTVGGPSLVGCHVGGQSGPNLFGGQSGPNLFGGQSGPALFGGMGLPNRNYANRLVGSMGRPNVNYANRLIGGPELVGRMGLPDRNYANRLVGGPELVGSHGVPVRNAAGLVVGRNYAIVGGELTTTQVQELRELMERAARARVLIQHAVERMIKTEAQMGPSAIQAAQVSTFKTRAVQQAITNPYASRYGTAAR